MIRKICLLAAIYLVVRLCAFAEDPEEAGKDKPTDNENVNSIAAIGAGLEWNMNSRENFAMGGVLSFDVNLGSSFAAGINATFSANFFGFYVIEPAALFRWYFLGKNHTGFFAQAEGGAFIIFDNNKTSIMPLGGLRAGFRLPLGQKFYIEPYGRIGYPFAFGMGVMAGIRIPNKTDEKEIEEINFIYKR